MKELPKKSKLAELIESFNGWYTVRREEQERPEPPAKKPIKQEVEEVEEDEGMEWEMDEEG